MTGSTDRPNEWMAQWLKMQENLMKEWALSLGKMMKSQASPQEWMKMSMTPGGLYEQWAKTLADLTPEWKRKVWESRSTTGSPAHRKSTWIS